MLGDSVFLDATNARANTVKLRFPSVGATENIIQFASLLKGKTVIKNSAREPEVVDLINFLNLCGAKIYGAGTKTITIYGVDKLHGCEYLPCPDRIVAGTITIATAICGGDVTITNSRPQENQKLIKELRRIGCQIDEKNDIIHIVRDKPLQNIGRISTGCYPEFPTDLQSQMLALACFCKGKTIVNENIFENRFLIVEELKKLGADIKSIDENSVVVYGNKKMTGCDVSALDLRGGAGIILACLGSNKKSRVMNAHFVDRGYEQIEKQLSSLGVKIKRKCPK